MCVCVCVCVCARGRGMGGGRERKLCWMSLWKMIPVLDNTSHQCCLSSPFFCVVMRINADKPSGNSDYYFQHITAREGEQERRDRGGKERQGKAKHKESHMEHITSSTAGFLKIWDTEKVSRGKVDAYLGVFCFFFRCNKVYRVCKLGCRFRILMGVIIRYITPTSTDPERFHENAIMMSAATALCTKAQKVTTFARCFPSSCLACLWGLAPKPAHPDTGGSSFASPHLPA